MSRTASMEDADELLRKASKKRNAIFKRGPEKYEAAAELYTRAGRLLRGSERDAEAGEAFRLASECHAKAKQEYEAGTALVSAANCLKVADSPRAARCLRLSGTHFERAGKISAAAKHLQEAGELYDSDGDPDDALECYMKAAEHFEAERAPGHATQCLARIGSIRAQRGEFDAAVDCLERAAKESLSSDLLRYSARDYMFRAFLCMIVKGDYATSAKNLDKYCSWDPAFAASREATFARRLVAACQSPSTGAVSDAVGDFEEVGKFGQWHAKMIAKIRKAVEINQYIASAPAPSALPTSFSPIV